MAKRIYLKDLNGKELVGKRILTEHYDSYFKKYSPECYVVRDSDSSGTRILIQPETGATYMNWREVKRLKIVEVLERNIEVEKILSDFIEIKKNEPKFPFGW